VAVLKHNLIKKIRPKAYLNYEQFDGVASF